MQSFKLRIEFMDSTGEVLDYVNKIEVRDGVLWAWEDNGYVRRHLGSWPLANIRKWKRED